MTSSKSRVFDASSRLVRGAFFCAFFASSRAFEAEAGGIGRSVCSRRRHRRRKICQVRNQTSERGRGPRIFPNENSRPQAARVRPSHIKRSKKTMKIVRYNCAYYKHDSTLKPLPFIQTTLVWPHIRHTAFCRSSRSCAYVPPPFIVTSSTHRTPPHRAQSVPPGTIASSSF